MTHAMVISGVHVDSITGKPVRYRVENSWGEDAGKEGYFVMTDAWFDQYAFPIVFCVRVLNMTSRYVYQVVVPKALAPKDLVQVFETGKEILLPPWDPLASYYF